MNVIGMPRRAYVAVTALASLAGRDRGTSYQTGRETGRPATSAMGAGPGEKLIAKVDEAKIVAEVKAGLASDNDISALKIGVDSRDGLVTLTGTVPSAAAQAHTVQIARDVKDVKSVDARYSGGSTPSPDRDRRS